MSTRNKRLLAIDAFRIGGAGSEPDTGVSVTRTKGGDLRISIEDAVGVQSDSAFVIYNEDVPALIAFLTTEFGL